MSTQNNINTFSSDKWKVNFSSIPTLNSTLQDLASLYEHSIKSITLPDYNVNFTQSNFRASVIHHPVDHENEDLSDLLIEFVVDENFLNYYNLFEYAQKYKYHNPNIPSPSTNINDKKSIFRLYDIKSIDVLILDNQRRTKKILSFKECFIHSISSIALVMGESENVTFTVNFKYQEVFLENP